MSLDIREVLQNVSGIKLPGGVVGKVCLVLIIVALCVGGMTVYSGNEWIIGGGIIVIFLLVFPMLWRLINFAERNPQAALLEGAEFLAHQQITMGTKDNPSIPLEVETLTEERHEELPPGEEEEVPETPIVAEDNGGKQ